MRQNYAEDNYDNPTVQRIRHAQGNFNYEEGQPLQDNIRREFRDEQLLENRAKYEGEWNVEDNTKNGRG